MSIIKKFNNFIYRSKYTNAHIISQNKPIDLALELTSTCNQRCGYCYHADQENLPFSKGFMDTDLAYMIIDQGADLGVHSIKFNLRGESTLHKEFKSITEYAKNYAKGLTYIDRITNSNFKFNNTREDIFEGLCNQTKVKISFDSFIPEVMHKQRAGSIHSLAMCNIDYFYNHPKRKNTEIVIQAVRTSLNKDEDIEGQVKKRWSEAKVSIRDMVTGRVDKDLSELENRKRDINNRQTCIQAHARLIVHHDGKVVACCPDISGKLQLGDATKETLYDIWNSKKAKELRESLKNKTAFSKEPCKSCSSFESYKGFKQNWES